MAVNLEPPRPENLLSISGVRLGIAKAGIRKPNRKDLLLVALDEGSRVAGVFTRNRFAAAPVQLCREHLDSDSAARAILVNTGVANAGTINVSLTNANDSTGNFSGVVSASMSVLIGDTKSPSDCRAPIVTMRNAAAAAVTIHALRSALFTMLVSVGTLSDI